MQNSQVQIHLLRRQKFKVEIYCILQVIDTILFSSELVVILMRKNSYTIRYAALVLAQPICNSR